MATADQVTLLASCDGYRHPQSARGRHRCRRPRRWRRYLHARLLRRAYGPRGSGRNGLYQHLPDPRDPAGGIDPLLGTNPLAFGFPVAGEDPVVVDFATSTSAIGHVRIANYSSAPIPPGIAIDRQGHPTLDAQAALDGALTPLGGHKGFALGLAVGLLSGPVIGALIGGELQRAIAAGQGERSRGHLFIATDPAAFGDPQQTSGASQRICPSSNPRARRQVSRKSAFRGNAVTGQKGRRYSPGIGLPASIWNNTLKIAGELGVEPPELAGPVRVSDILAIGGTALVPRCYGVVPPLRFKMVRKPMCAAPRSTSCGWRAAGR